MAGIASHRILNPYSHPLLILVQKSSGVRSKSEVTVPSINTYHVCSASIVSNSCARGLGSIPIATIYFFFYHSTQSWQICQNKVQDEKRKKHPICGDKGIFHTFEFFRHMNSVEFTEFVKYVCKK